MNEILTESLKKHFGYSEFRPLQQEIIETILNKKDVLVLMPTGGGKSICFQLPAIQFGGLTLVISPLISLMQDQVESLKRNGVAAEFYNSSQNESQRSEIRKRINKGDLTLLYTSPESLFQENDRFLQELSYSLVVIDEAHCASMWGHDFRPEYQFIARFRNRIPEVPFAAFTATADKITRKDIAGHLGLKDAKLFISSFDRPNIYLNVPGNVAKKDKWNDILKYIKQKKDLSGIIYCLSRKETEEFSDFLKKAGVNAHAYHAGMNPEIRAKVQNEFLTDDLQVICATIAFGMGIDKSNVRWVIHNNLPKNLEGYYQEIGRAGRDGEPAEALLYYTMRDVKLLSDFARDSSQKELLLEKLNRILSFAETNSCRRKILLAYFSEDYNSDCGSCDSCDNPVDRMEATKICQMAISALLRCKEQLTASQLIDVIRGAKTSEVFENKWNEVKTYGIGQEFSWKEWNHFIKEFKNIGVFEIAYDQNMHLKTTSFGLDVVHGKTKVKISKYAVEKATRELEVKELTENEMLFDRLRLVRKKIAVEENVPPFYIFSDASLRDMAIKAPRNREQFLLVSGVGETKLNKYAHHFLGAITGFSFLPEPMEIKSKPKKKSNTVDETYQYYKLGQTIEEIAQNRKLSETTVLSHIGELIKDGRVDNYLHLISPLEMEKIEAVYLELSKPTQMKPIHDALNGEIAYGKIRIALSVFERDAEKIKA
ncbi:MAG: DNA helicase RecQ [Bacteroidetes bacterium]|nr:DNA helicase RecQ [Bacteroidota bacterium]